MLPMCYYRNRSFEVGRTRICGAILPLRPPVSRQPRRPEYSSRVSASSQASENRTISYPEELPVLSQCILDSACPYLTGFQPTNSVRQEPFFAYTVMAIRPFLIWFRRLDFRDVPVL